MGPSPRVPHVWGGLGLGTGLKLGLSLGLGLEGRWSIAKQTIDLNADPRKLPQNCYHRIQCVQSAGENPPVFAESNDRLATHGRVDQGLHVRQLLLILPGPCRCGGRHGDMMTAYKHSRRASPSGLSLLRH